MSGGGRLSINEIDQLDSNYRGYTVSEQTHLSWGRWEGNVQDNAVSAGQTTSVSTRHQRGYWIAGNLTPANSIPREGAATYNGQLHGTLTEYIGPSILNSGTSSQISSNDSKITHELQGSLSMAVNFETGSVGGDITNLNYEEGGAQITWLNQGILNGSLPNYDDHVSQPTFNLSVESNEGVSGTLSAQFFGPNAEQVGGTFNLTESSSVRAVGVFSGSK